jgi:hypothetical protein
MWRRVGLMWTDVSEERIASIFRVEKSSETSVHTRPTQRHIPEDGILHTYVPVKFSLLLSTESARTNLQVFGNNVNGEFVIDLRKLYNIT